MAAYGKGWIFSNERQRPRSSYFKKRYSKEGLFTRTSPCSHVKYESPSSTITSHFRIFHSCRDVTFYRQRASNFVLYLELRAIEQFEIFIMPTPAVMTQDLSLYSLIWSSDSYCPAYYKILALHLLNTPFFVQCFHDMHKW